MMMLSAQQFNVCLPQDIASRFLLTQDVAKSSRAQYKKSISKFFGWLGENGLSLDDLSPEHLIFYKEQLQESLSSLTVAGHIVVVRKFFEWSEANKLYPNIAKHLKTPRRKQEHRKQPLSAQQVKKLLQYADTQSLRDRAIINLCVRTGLRVSEIASPRISDIVFKNSKRVLMIKGKGDADISSFVVLTDKANSYLSDYLECRELNSVNEPLFASESNRGRGAMTSRSISRILKSALVSIGLPDRCYTAHSLRHTAATLSLQNGASIEMTQHMLRHKNIATTQIYTNTIMNMRRLENSGESILDDVF